MIHDIIQPLSPTGEGWVGGEDVRHKLRSAFPITWWWYVPLRLYVLSAVEVAVDTDGFSPGPEYHLSVSHQTCDLRPSRCSAEEGAFILQAFGKLDGWEEDNHVPDGKVRNYWRAVAENMVGRACACKETEHLVVEGDYEHRPMEMKP